MQFGPILLHFPLFPSLNATYLQFIYGLLTEVYVFATTNFSSSVPVILRTGLIIHKALGILDLEELKTKRASVNALVLTRLHPLPFISLPSSLRTLLHLNFLIQVINNAPFWREQTNKHRRVCLQVNGNVVCFICRTIFVCTTSDQSFIKFSRCQLAISISGRHLSNNES